MEHLMVSSDEEGEIVPDFVNSYWFENDKGEFVSLFSSTLLWSINEVICDSQTKIFLRGTTDDGLQKIHKHIIGWRFELPYEQPQISVLLRDKNWITLLKPRKCFESTIRTVLVTVYWLHFVKWNPEESRISIWDKILKAFSSFDVTPSENDVLNHVTFIREAAQRDKDLTNSKHLLNFIEKTSSNEGLHKDVHTTKKSKFIVDSEEEEEVEMEEEEEDEDEEEIDKSDGELNVDGEQTLGYDTVCAICDNGGEILPCEGRCLRSFHATNEAGRDSFCPSLGYTSTQVNAFPNFYCENCKFKQHQCFACGKLGSSDESSKAEVYPCVIANCGHYYHLECVGRLLTRGIGTEPEKMRKSISIERTFVCPLHICSICSKGENRNVHDLQFAMCRRCPKAYHRKCLPKEISFTYDYDMGFELRAWDGLLDKRILMYCMDHELDMELGTPARDHLVFPGKEFKRKMSSCELLGKEKVAISLRQSFEDLPPKKTLVPNQVIKESISIHKGGSSSVMEKTCSKKDTHFSTGSVKFDMARKYLNVPKMSVPKRSLPSPEKRLSLIKDNLSCSSRLHEARSQQQRSVGRIKETSLEKPLVKKVKTLVETNADMEKRILALVKESTSTFNVEEFKKKFCASSHFAETVLKKNLTQGKVEGSVKAIQIALKRLGEGCSIEEAKAICDPEVLRQIFIWQKQLKVYLAPFLHGTRYTSFGRHFTKIDKLKEIVDRLHWYVQNGDTVLDFCCGANDFSCLMKSKLDQTGKLCSFKNYDLFQAKNDFNFEKRDWMSVTAEELPNGSQLIIGLNPPFGVKGSLANKFIAKALTFKPKLLVLIVPKVTKRLDRKKGGYNLIWEDDEMFAGKSFYLPGSVDIHDKQLEDWNLKPPPLYLWSRPDWTARHRKIAQTHCHIKNDVYNNKGKEVKNYLMEENHDCYQDYRDLHTPDNVLSIFDGVPDDNGDITLEEGAGATSYPSRTQSGLLSVEGLTEIEECSGSLFLRCGDAWRGGGVSEMEQDNFFNQSHRLNSSYYDPKAMFMCPQIESHFPYPSSNLVEVAATTNNFQTTPHVQNNYPSTTCNFYMVGDHNDIVENSNTLSNNILPNFMNSSIRDSAFESTTTTKQVNHSLKPSTHLRKTRSSSESADHIASERKRRLKLTQNFIALSAMIPGLKKTEKSYILQEAINHMNQLQERVRELETQNEKINIAYSAMLDKLSKNEDSITCETNSVGYTSSEALPEVTARVSEKSVLIAIHCEKQSDVMYKILNLVANLRLSITNSSIFPFGASTLKIIIIAQMEEEYSMAIGDLVKNLRKVLLTSNDVQH